MELFNMGSLTKKASKAVGRAQKILYKPKQKGRTNTGVKKLAKKK